jgi:hypothetical protein
MATLMMSIVNGQELPAPAPATPEPSPFVPAPAPSAPDPFANTPTAPSTVSGQTNKKTKVVYKEKSYYDFEDVLINGNLRKPDGSFIFRKNNTPFSSALNLRRSFIPELKESSVNTR